MNLFNTFYAYYIVFYLFISQNEILIQIKRMQRLKQKQLQQLKRQKQQAAQDQKAILKQFIKSQQRIQILLNFVYNFLKKENIQNLSEYSPTQISRLVFDKQLQIIKNQFARLPGGQVKVQHFIIIMVKVMNFAFEKCPFYMVGLKDMFYQIVKDGSDTINYQQLFKYILGELVTIKQQEQNTEFQVQIQQRKKQDYLLHDNGIKRIKYSKDLKMVFSLDERSNLIKIYDNEMKNINKFCPKKEKHNNRFPYIHDFDYSEISTRLGVILSDDTISTIHVPNLLGKTTAEFDSAYLNEVVYPLPQQMKLIFFIQMLNKWMTVSDTGLELYLFDMERVRSQPQKVMTKLTVNTNQLKIKQILQVVPLSCICIVAGNQVNFYNENVSEVKFRKFVHVQGIQHFKYSDQKNQFYLCGLQKTITIFSISRSGNPSRLWTFPINKIITDFEVFPYFDTIIIADENNEIKLMHQSTRTVYQQINYNHIVKSKDKFISISKMSKNEFAIYQTYQIIMNQQKIAIERGIQYTFLPYYHIDTKKDQLFISVNSQIIAFSLLSGQIRKNYNIDNSNLEKHQVFFTANKTPLFVLNHEFKIYQVYTKDEILQGQNRHYSKKINIEQMVSSHYDQAMQHLIIVSKQRINQIRNDKNNNFNIMNEIYFQGFGHITKSSFCQATKTTTFLTNKQLIYQMKNYEHVIQRCYKFVFPKDNKQYQEGLISNFHYNSHYNIFILFTNKNQIYFIDITSNSQIYFSIQDHLPVKLKHLKFTNFRYQLVQIKKGIQEHFVLVTDQTGFIIQFPLTKIYQQFQITQKNIVTNIKPMFKETQIITHQGIQITQLQLSQGQRLRKTYKEVGLMKAHQKSISVALKMRLEVEVTLTISIDGYIRLWNEQYDLLFSLKIPTLMRLTWNMKQIQDIKNKKSIDQLLKIFEQHYQQGMHETSSPVQTYNKSKRLKKERGNQIPRINLNEPIKIDIQNKDIEQIVMQQQEYSSAYSNKFKARTHHFFHNTQKVYPHPWRHKKEFIKIFEKASPPRKYKQRMPEDLLQMRNSLDMTEKVKQVKNYKQAQMILPQLSFYEPEKSIIEKVKIQPKVQQEQGQNFETCLYVKSIKKKKKINEFDEIDKEFKKKEMVLTARKWVPKKRKERTNSVAEMKAELSGTLNEGKLDPIKAIQKIFEEHNRECMQTKKGRLIKIPKINLSKDIY